MTSTVDVITPPALRIIPADVIHQPYLGKNSTSGTPEACARYCETAKAAGLEAIAWHGGPRYMLAHWAALSKIANDHGLLAGAAFGLDGTQDFDGSELTPQEKGELMGHVLAFVSCVFALGDAEGRWDGLKKVLAHMDEAGALALGEAMRAVLRAAMCENKLVGDQLWFAIESHGDPRHPGRPIGSGGPFKGFPADEFAAKMVNWIRFRQLYCNNEHDKGRYRRDKAWMERDWTKFDQDLIASGNSNLVLELGVTLQSYGWDDILGDLAECLIEYVVCKSQPVIAWGEPTMSPAFIAVVKGVHVLRDERFAMVGVAPRDAVRAYQTAYNKLAAVGEQLTVDGDMGLLTLRTMGIRP